MYFWYSNKQKVASPMGHPRNFAKLADGRIVEYTTMAPTMEHGCVFDDMVFLGEGEYDHSKS